MFLFSDIWSLREAIAALASLAGAYATGVLVLGLELPHSQQGFEPGGTGRLAPGLLENLPDAAFLFDTEGRLLYCNHIAEQLCSSTRDELRGISIADMNRLLSARDEFDHPVEVPSMGVNRALRGEVVRNVRRVFRHPTRGNVLETVTSASPVHGPAGDMEGALLIVRDVTEILQLQRRLANSQRHREVGQMAAGLAHDFDNVLDTVIKAVTLLEMGANLAPDERRTYTHMIRNAVSRGAEIVQRVRDYLRSGAGDRGLVDMCRVLQDALELTHPLWYARRGMKVVREMQPVPPVSANASDLRRVFANLIINALEAMPDGGQLIVRCEPIGQHVRAIVSDTGHGIPAEHQNKLFEPYFTTKEEGTGLGLSGAQRIINSLRGTIGFQTEEGKGSSFVVDLPAAGEVILDKAA